MISFILEPDRLQKGEQKPSFRKMTTREIKHKSLSHKGFQCPYCGAKDHFNPYIYAENFRDKLAGDIVDQTLFGKCFNASCKAGQSEKGIPPTFDNGYRYSMAGYPTQANKQANTQKSWQAKNDWQANKGNITTKKNINSSFYQNITAKEKNISLKKSYSHFEDLYPSSLLSLPSLPLLPPHYDTISKQWIRNFDFSSLNRPSRNVFFKPHYASYGTFCGYDCELMDYLLSLGYQKDKIIDVFYEMKVSGSFYKEIYLPNPTNPNNPQTTPNTLIPNAQTTLVTNSSADTPTDTSADTPTDNPHNPLNNHTLRVKGTVYWYVDEWGEVRGGKIVYSINGHRVSKKNTPYLSEKQQHLFSVFAVQSYYKRLPENADKDFKTTIFGLPRLIKKIREIKNMQDQNSKTISQDSETLSQYLENLPIYLYESEKTAVMMTLEYPSAVHLAVGGEQNFKYDILLSLFNLGIRCFVACPDKAYYESWLGKAKEIKKLFSRYFPKANPSDELVIEVSNTLESVPYASLPPNSDLADVIEMVTTRK